MRAIKLQKRAARVGFDWPSTDEVLDKISEEIAELRGAKSEQDKFEEFGDLLFVIANLARHLKIDPEAALRAANAKFTRRFEGVEERLAEQGKRPEDSDLAEGLYLKLEDSGRVIDRFKFVRGDFLQAIQAAEGHWHDRPILPNALAEGVDIFAPVLGVEGAYDA